MFLQGIALQTRDPAAPGQVPLDSAVKPASRAVHGAGPGLPASRDTGQHLSRYVIGEESHLTLSPETKPPCSPLVPAQHP